MTYGPKSPACKKLSILMALLCLTALLSPLAQGRLRAIGAAGDLVTLNDAYNLRTAPSTGSSIVATAASGTQFTILETLSGDATPYGDQWYRVSYRGQSVYLAANDDEQTVTPGSGTEGGTPSGGEISAEWAEVLNSFPPSYRDALTQLHERYPAWNFVALRVPYSLQTVVAAETANPNRNLVPLSYSYFRKNTKVVESPDWVAISSEGLLYLMDPRNSLTEERIFQFERVTTDGDQQATQTLQNMFAGNSALQEMIPAIEKVANEEGLLPTFLAARIKQEVRTGSGVAAQARGDIEITAARLRAAGYTNSSAYPTLYPDARYYNVFNVGAYNGDDPAFNGVLYATGISSSASEKEAYGLPWDSLEKAIRGGSRFIRRAYVDNKQNTHYLQKFNVAADDFYGEIWHQYMANALAPLMEGKSAYYAYQEAGELANSKTFLIPVFDGSPAAPAPYPSANDGSWAEQEAEVWTTVTPSQAPAEPTPAPTLLGDATGDGKVNARDLVAVQKHIMQIASLSESQQLSADVNRDGKLNARDLVAIQKHIMQIVLLY